VDYEEVEARGKYQRIMDICPKEDRVTLGTVLPKSK
jgi:hypothetical protein